MGRIPRIDIGDEIYHIINRSNARSKIFRKRGDYVAFIKSLIGAREKFNMRILSFCIMPNHWHLVLYPRKDGDLARFVGWLTLTHSQRYHAHNNSAGLGHIYQGRYKSFIVKHETYLLRLCRYVERNALRAGLVENAHGWEWGSAWVRLSGSKKQKAILSDWPVEIPEGYEASLNINDDSDGLDDLDEIRTSVKRSRPYGDGLWVGNIVEKFGMEGTVRSRGGQYKQ